MFRHVVFFRFYEHIDYILKQLAIVTLDALYYDISVYLWVIGDLEHIGRYFTNFFREVCYA